MAPSLLLSRLAIATSLGTAAAFEPGCLAKGFTFSDPVSGTPHATVAGATSCGNMCVGDSSCKGFTYLPTSGECWFSQSGSPEKMVSSTQASYVGWPGALCSSPPAACVASVKQGSDWPAATAEGSRAAFNIGYQPASLQCWPVTAFSGEPESCGEVIVLDDTATGWAGKCEGLSPVTVPENTTCETMCFTDVNCPSYQVGTDGSCWHGVGMGCWSNVAWNKSWTPVAAKRYQRGTIRVLQTLDKVQVTGLTQVFDQQDAANMPDPAKQCANTCYSVMDCQYWQLVNSASCYIELPPRSVAYPLTTADAPNATVPIVGEFIQHVCLESSVTTTTTQEAGGIPWWGWFLIALALLCCLCCILGAILKMCCGTEEKETSRGLKMEEVPVIPAQPVATQMYQVPMYQQAPMAYHPGGPPQYVPYQQPLPPFDAMDRNQDGVITREEFVAMQGRR